VRWGGGDADVRGVNLSCIGRQAQVRACAGWGGDVDVRGVNLSCVGRQAQMRGAVNINMYVREVDTLGIGMHKQGCEHQCACERSQDLGHWHTQTKGNSAVNADVNVREVDRALTP